MADKYQGKRIGEPINIDNAYKDLIQIQLGQALVNDQMVDLLGIGMDKTSSYLTYDQVDNLIQKLIDIRRQWPMNKENK